MRGVAVVGEHGVGERAERRGDGRLEAGLHLHVLGDQPADAVSFAATSAVEPSFWSRASERALVRRGEGVALALVRVQLLAQPLDLGLGRDDLGLGELVGRVEVGLARVGRSRPPPRARANSALRGLAPGERRIERVLLAQHLAAHRGEPGCGGLGLPGELRDLEVVPRDERALRGDLLVERVEARRGRRAWRPAACCHAASAAVDLLAQPRGLGAGIRRPSAA